MINSHERRRTLAFILLGRVKAASGVLCGSLTQSKTLRAKAEKIYNLAKELEHDLDREPSITLTPVRVKGEKDDKPKRSEG